ncbi:MAG TPA: hypothetical protein VK948_02070 [Aeromicrobium sp.]|nr:hypothetical protein [Aeromicrobium sp.]
MSGLDLYGLFTVCETCDSEIDFPEGPESELGICRACGEAFLIEFAPSGAVAQSS